MKQALAAALACCVLFTGPFLTRPTLSAEPAPGADDWRRPWHTDHAVRLTAEGNVPLVVSMFKESGELVRAPGRYVTVMHEGKPFGKPGQSTDPEGRIFLSLAPGIYSIAVGSLHDDTGFAFTSIRVLPALQPQPRPRPEFKPRSDTKAVTVADAVDVPPPAVAPRTAVGPPPAGGPRPQTQIVPRVPEFIELALIRGEDIVFLRALIAQKMSSPAAARLAPPRTSSAAALGASRSLASLLRSASGTASTGLVAREFAEAYRDRWGSVPYDSPWHFNHELILEANRSLRGNLRTFNDQGELVPVGNAEIWFIRNGKLQKSLATGDLGDYYAAWFEPGVYSVVAVNQNSFGGHGVRFVAPDLGPDEPALRTTGGTAARPVSFAVQAGGIRSAIGTPSNSNGFINGGGGGGGLGAGGGAFGAGPPAPVPGSPGAGAGSEQAMATAVAGTAAVGALMNELYQYFASPQ